MQPVAGPANPPERLLDRYRFLGYAIAPVLVLVLAQVVFEGAAPRDADFTGPIRKDIAAQAPVVLTQAVIELKARYIWFAGALLDLVISGFALLFAVRVIFRLHPSERRRVVVRVGVGLGLIGLAFMALSPWTNNALYRVVYCFTFHALQSYHESSHSFGASFLSTVHAIIILINVLAVLAPLATVLAACSVMVPPPEGQTQDLRFLAERLRILNDLLSAGSALMVAGVLHMAVWLHWVAALVTDEKLRAGLEGLALAITTYWGAAFTLLIITAYVPAATRLHGWGVAAIEAVTPIDSEKSPNKLLEDHGFAPEPMQRLPQTALMLAPLIAGPITSILAGMMGR